MKLRGNINFEAPATDNQIKAVEQAITILEDAGISGEYSLPTESQQRALDEADSILALEAVTIVGNGAVIPTKGF